MVEPKNPPVDVEASPLERSPGPRPRFEPTPPDGPPTLGPPKRPHMAQEAVASTDGTLVPAADEGAQGEPPLASPQAPPPAPVDSAEAWARKRRIDPAIFAGARSKNGWAIGQILTEEDFGEGVKNFLSIEAR